MEAFTSGQIVEIRKTLNLSRRELADLCGVDYSTVGRWERSGLAALKIKGRPLMVLFRLKQTAKGVEFRQLLRFLASSEFLMY